MSIEVDTVTLPAEWAPALINGDRSGLSDDEVAALDGYLARYAAKGWRVVDVARDDNGEPCEPYFSWSYGFHGGTARGGDLLLYVIHVLRPAELTTRRPAAAIRAKLSAGLLERYEAARAAPPRADRPFAAWACLDAAREAVAAGRPARKAGPQFLGERFSGYAGETIEGRVGRYQVKAELVRDHDTTPPWEREDGHGPVSEWTSRDKQPGERVLCSDRGNKRFYDFAGAVVIAKRDGWDSEPYGTGTRGQKAARAVERDFERLRRWCNDQWNYVGVVVTVSREKVELGSASLWGIESDAGDYLTETALELLPDALAEAVKAARNLSRKLAA